MDVEHVMTIYEVAIALGRTPETIRRWDRSGRLRPAARIAGRRVYDRREVQRFALAEGAARSGDT